jgi:TrmH family RNA methyltransferase
MSDSAPPPLLTSVANPTVRAALALRERRERARTGLIVVDGAREIARALDGGVRIRQAFFDADAPDAADTAAVVDRLGTLGVVPIRIAGPARDRLVYGDRTGTLLAVGDAPSTDLSRVARVVGDAANPLVVVVEDVEKPGNLGAILRSADGAGATAVVAASGRRTAVDVWNPNTIRASLGTVFNVPLAVAPTAEVLAWLRASGMRVVAARLDATASHWDVDLGRPVAMVVGSEADGLTAAWSDPDLGCVRIPMAGRADSLNVSVATAILLYEARRQRREGEAGRASEFP